MVFLSYLSLFDPHVDYVIGIFSVDLHLCITFMYVRSTIQLSICRSHVGVRSLSRLANVQRFSKKCRSECIFLMRVRQT